MLECTQFVCFFLCWTVPYRQLSAGKRLWEMPSYLSLVLETILVCIIFFGAGQRHMTIRCWRVLLICRCWKVPCLSLVLGSAAYIGAGGFHVGYWEVLESALVLDSANP